MLEQYFANLISRLEYPLAFLKDIHWTWLSVLWLRGMPCLHRLSSSLWRWASWLWWPFSCILLWQMKYKLDLLACNHLVAQWPSEAGMDYQYTCWVDRLNCLMSFQEQILIFLFKWPIIVYSSFPWCQESKNTNSRKVVISLAILKKGVKPWWQNRVFVNGIARQWSLWIMDS